MSSQPLDRLQVAFDRWALTGAHGVVWFDDDRELAEAVAEVLGVDLKWDDDDE